MPTPITFSARPTPGFPTIQSPKRRTGVCWSTTASIFAYNFSADCLTATKFSTIGGNGTQIQANTAQKTGYFEVRFSGGVANPVGLTPLGAANNNWIGFVGNSIGYHSGTIWRNNVNFATYATFGATDTVMVALKLVGATLYAFFGVSGVWQSGTDPSAGTGGIDVTALFSSAVPAASANDVNESFIGAFTASDLKYPIPTGLTAWDGTTANNRTGTASGTLPLTGSATATAKIQGTTSGTLPLTGSGTGKVALRSTATGTLPLTGAATAKAAIRGSGSGSAPLSGSSTGAVKVRGSAAGTLPLTGSGSESEKVRGSGSSAIPLTGSAAAAVKVRGSGAGTLPFTGGGSASVKLRGAGSGILPLSGAAAISAAVHGNGAGALALTGAAAGKVTIRGGANDNLALAGSAAGTVTSNSLAGIAPDARTGRVTRSGREQEVDRAGTTGVVDRNSRTGAISRSSTTGIVPARRRA